MQRPVPLAYKVAAEAGPRAVAPAAERRGCACPHKAEPCPALVKLLGHVPGDSAGARDWMARLTPCGGCRVGFEAKRASLRGLRLGKRERDILLGAGALAVFTVTAAGMSRPESAARRRAAQTLAKSGLVAAAPGSEALTPQHQARAAVTLTPLGRYVLDAFGRYIQAGKPVRWTRPAARARLPGEEPSTLVQQALELARSELHATLDELKRVLIAAVARPVRDPGLLDTVTRHLAEKAQGLRDLLEARPLQAAQKAT